MLRTLDYVIGRCTPSSNPSVSARQIPNHSLKALRRNCSVFRVAGVGVQTEQFQTFVYVFWTSRYSTLARRFRSFAFSGVVL